MQRYIYICGYLLLIASASGCRTAVPYRYSSTTQQPMIQSVSPTMINAGSTTSTPAVGESRLDDSELTTVGFESVTSVEPDENSKVQPSALSDAELSLEQLIADVQAIHPTMQAMYAAWQAAAQRYPQAVSLEDPMFGATLAPASVRSRNTDTAYMVEASQKLPWHGKRALRGAVERASADSASQDVETTRQKLAEIAELAYWDYYVALRLLNLNDENREILESFRDSAVIRYENALVTQQDVLQADI
ncbi:MAG: TolC family protein, partial [Planctomycetota bacterium]|nr:TolC family protein [Planctomycetota bacterium]